MLRPYLAVICLTFAATPGSAEDQVLEARAGSGKAPTADCSPRSAAAATFCKSPRHLQRYNVGDLVGDDVTLRSYFPGVDLVQLTDGTGYLRTNEYVYRVDKSTRAILDVIRIGDVILR